MGFLIKVHSKKLYTTHFLHAKIHYMYKVMLINESPSKTEDAQVQPTYRNRHTTQRERENYLKEANLF